MSPGLLFYHTDLPFHVDLFSKSAVGLIVLGARDGYRSRIDVEENRWSCINLGDGVEIWFHDV